MRATIARREASVIQSGKSTNSAWRMSFAPTQPKTVDPLMGWAGTRDMMPEIILDFPSLEAAVAYAERQGLEYELFSGADTIPRQKSYAANYQSDRKIPWSH